LLLVVLVNGFDLSRAMAQVMTGSPIGGGPPGGAVEAIVLDPKDPATVYAATNWSGVFKSTDGGESWTTINSGLANSMVYSLAISPSDNAMVYAGTRNGVFKTVDGGRHWTAASYGLPKAIGRTQIDMLAIDPTNPKIVYAGTFDKVYKTINGAASWSAILSHPMVTQTSRFAALAVDPSHPATVYVAASDRGLFKSGDGGRNWKVITTGADFEYVEDVLVDPSNSTVIYVSDRGGKILRSADSGRNWIRADAGLPVGYGGSLTLAVNPKDSRTLYAASSASVTSPMIPSEGRFFRSSSRGEVWTKVGARISNANTKVLVADPVHADTLYAGTGGGILKTVDGGMSWRSTNSGITNSNISAIAVAPSESGVLYVGASGGGIAKSRDGGATWVPVNTGLTSDDVSALAIDPTDAARVYAGAGGGIFRSTNGGASWSEVKALPSMAICSLAIDRSNSAVLYATTTGDGKAFKSTNGGDTWDEIRFGFPRTGGCGLIMNPADPTILYASTYDKSTIEMLKSTDAGKTWQKDAVDYRIFGRVWQETAVLTIDPDDSNTLHTASVAGIFKSTNRGATWVRTASPPRGLERLVLDPKNSNTIYGQGGSSISGEGRGVFKSTDGGKSWKLINSGLADPAMVRSLLVDPTDSSTLYIGTPHGVFKSTNGGEGWVPTGSKEQIVHPLKPNAPRP
jgi:photosystem II stability/assembly factor-like uncharacterized protein